MGSSILPAIPAKRNITRSESGVKATNVSYKKPEKEENFPHKSLSIKVFEPLWRV